MTFDPGREEETSPCTCFLHPGVETRTLMLHPAMGCSDAVTGADASSLTAFHSIPYMGKAQRRSPLY